VNERPELEARFLELVGLPPAQRRSRLAPLDPALRAELESLLACHDGPSPLDRPLLAAAQAPLARVGPFTLLERLGEGAMGVVWRARQDAPARDVALKMLRGGLWSAATLARFRREAELLARLHHPGIAQVYAVGDDGCAGDPRPWFAMELIEGPTLLEWAARERPDLRTRLELVARIADALDHAHRRGVVHRDLKASNVLVATVDGRPQPVLVDFGIARAPQDDAGAATTLTGQVLGTLATMAPEQAAGESVDARCDVYALGAVAYELCTGSPALSLESLALVEALRAVREELPVPAEQRVPRLAGDVSVILGKALEKSPARRYESAAALAEDLRAHLEARPIRARPPTQAYLAARFVQRHRALALGAAAVLAALLAGLATTAWQAVRAAERGEQARAALERTRAVSAFQSSVLERVAPARGGRELRLVDVLEATAASLPGELARTPDVEAALRASLGAAWRGLGLYAPARAQLERALELYAHTLGAAHPEALRTRVALAGVLGDLSLDATALESIEAVLPQARALGADGLELCLEAEAVRAMRLANLGRLAEAEAAACANLEARRRAFGDGDLRTATAHGNLGAVLWLLGRLDDSRLEQERALAIARRALDPAHPRLPFELSRLANTLRHLGQVEQAAALYQEALDLGLPVYGDDHPDVWTWMNNLAGARSELGDRARAEELFTRVFELRTLHLGAEHADTLVSRNNLALLFAETGRAAEAIALHEEGLSIKRRVMGDDRESTLLSLSNLGQAHLIAGDPAAALPCFEEACQRAQRVWPQGHWREALFAEGLGECLIRLGLPEEARAVLEPALERMREAFGDDDARTRSIAGRLESL
jgi:tetratricopeptide (TPR) repeat protein/tRNA A-37 threonylcarbamoyl transferase component Bud32